MTKVIVILNESHHLLPDQERVLNAEFAHAEIAILHVPSSGWTLLEMRKVIENDIGNNPVVFASPIPAMILMLVNKRAGNGVYVLHNDNRVAREIRNNDGTVKIIHTVAADGWQVVGTYELDDQ
jgi:hypothetical protein